MLKKKQNLKITEKYPIIAIPVILFLTLLVLVFANLVVKLQIFRDSTKISTFKIPVSDYPIIKNNNPLQTSANGVVIMVSDSKKILYEKNKDVRFSPASTTKIMTAYTALQYYKPDDILTVKGDFNVDSVLGIVRGDKFKFSDLLYMMMLPSDNLAAETISQNYPGGKKEFTKKMNENADALKLSNTFFSDAVGLDDDNDYTTPYDLAILSSEAMKSDIIKIVASTREINVSDATGGRSYDVVNINKLLDFDGIIGLKTGHTQQAGDVLVTAKKEGSHLLIMVVMNSEDRFSDTIQILNFLRDNINFLTIRP